MLKVVFNALNFLFIISFLLNYRITLLAYVFLFFILPSIAAMLWSVDIGGSWVIEHSSLCRRLGIKGLAIWPVIFVVQTGRTAKLKRANQIVRHERIHLAQQLECLVLPFYILYGAEEIIRQLVYKQAPEDAYRDISFEREAYQNERFDSDIYLNKKRNACEWWKMYLVRTPL